MSGTIGSNCEKSISELREFFFNQKKQYDSQRSFMGTNKNNLWERKFDVHVFERFMTNYDIKIEDIDIQNILKILYSKY